MAGLERTECSSFPVGLYNLEPSTTSDRVAESPVVSPSGVEVIDLSRRLKGDDAVTGVDWNDRASNACRHIAEQEQSGVGDFLVIDVSTQW